MNIYQRMSAITEEISTVAKNLEVGFGQSKYKAVGEADVLRAVKPLEKKHGVYSYPVSREVIADEVFVTTNSKGNPVNNKFIRVKVTYRFVNMDEPTDLLEIVSYGDGVDPQDKAPGKAMTYADKYALLKAYKIITGDDPDQNYSQEGTFRQNPNICSDSEKKRVWAMAKNAGKDPKQFFIDHGATYDGLTSEQYVQMVKELS